jgi:hypothetical protein
VCAELERIKRDGECEERHLLSEECMELFNAMIKLTSDEDFILERSMNIKLMGAIQELPSEGPCTEVERKILSFGLKYLKRSALEKMLEIAITDRGCEILYGMTLDALLNASGLCKQTQCEIVNRCFSKCQLGLLDVLERRGIYITEQSIHDAFKTGSAKCARRALEKSTQARAKGHSCKRLEVETEEIFTLVLYSDVSMKVYDYNLGDDLFAGMLSSKLESARGWVRSNINFNILSQKLLVGGEHQDIKWLFLELLIAVTEQYGVMVRLHCLVVTAL